MENQQQLLQLIYNNKSNLIKIYCLLSLLTKFTEIGSKNKLINQLTKRPLVLICTVTSMNKAACAFQK